MEQLPQLTDRAVRPLGVVLDTPLLHQPSGVTERDELMFIQAFVTETSIEAFDVRIVHRLARSDER